MLRLSSRSPLLWIFAALAVWSIGLAIAVFFDWSDQWRIWRSVIVLGCMGLFLSGWAAILWRTGRLK